MDFVLHNPHSILAILKTRPSDVLQIHCPQKEGIWGEIAHFAQKFSIAVASPQRKNFKKNTPSRLNSNFAWVREKSSVCLSTLFDHNQPKSIYLALDCLQDPYNVGSIFRTAAFFGIKGILLTQERSVQLTAQVYEAASGGIEWVPFSLQTNLSQALKVAKKSGIWILGSSVHEGEKWTRIPRDRSWMLILGNEHQGIRHLTQKNCEMLCKIPSQSSINSLNVAVAAGILMAHLTQVEKES